MVINIVLARLLKRTDWSDFYLATRMAASSSTTTIANPTLSQLRAKLAVVVHSQTSHCSQLQESRLCPSHYSSLPTAQVCCLDPLLHSLFCIIIILLNSFLSPQLCPALSQFASAERWDFVPVFPVQAPLSSPNSPLLCTPVV